MLETLKRSAYEKVVACFASYLSRLICIFLFSFGEIYILCSTIRSRIKSIVSLPIRSSSNFPKCL